MATVLDSVFVAKFSLGGAGPTVAVKDCIDIAGFPTCAGSETLAEAPAATRHADVVASLLAGGAHIVGKANMHELAYGVTGINRWTGTPVNPRYPALIPGGSSSGSAVAVAAGLVDIAIGTDTGGSIRMPAACCGVYGFKPTYGRISRAGASPAHSTLDCIGPFARSMEGIDRGMTLIDPGYAVEATSPRATLGTVAADADPAIAACVAAQLDRPALTLLPRPLAGMEEAFEAGLVLIAAESWAAFGGLADDPRMGPDVRARLRDAGNVTARQIAEAEAVRARFTAAVDAALEGVDGLVLPTLPAVPPALDEIGDAARMLRATALIRPFNLSGHPAITIPIDGPDGRPAGIQIVGRKNADAALCALARLVAAGVR